jgi:hypothetical protein
MQLPPTSAPEFPQDETLGLALDLVPALTTNSNLFKTVLETFAS